MSGHLVLRAAEHLHQECLCSGGLYFIRLVVTIPPQCIAVCDQPRRCSTCNHRFHSDRSTCAIRLEQSRALQGSSNLTRISTKDTQNQLHRTGATKMVQCQRWCRSKLFGAAVTPAGLMLNSTKLGLYSSTRGLAWSAALHPVFHGCGSTGASAVTLTIRKPRLRNSTDYPASHATA